MDASLKFILLLVAIAVLARLAKGAAKQAGIPTALAALALGAAVR